MEKKGKITAYEFYRYERKGQDRFIGVLPERRKDPERITHASIMNWAKTLTPKHVLRNWYISIGGRFKRKHGIIGNDLVVKDQGRIKNDPAFF